MTKLQLLVLLVTLTGCTTAVSSGGDDGGNSVRNWPRGTREIHNNYNNPDAEKFGDTDDDQDAKKRSIFATGKSLMNSVVGMGVGTFFSGMNAAGQTVSNMAGDGVVGHLGNLVTKVAENYAGKIKFILFTPKNPVVGFELNKTTAPNSPFDKSQDVIAVIHGFTPAGYFVDEYDNIISSFRVKDGLMAAKLQHNIILVDWTGLSSDGAYVFSSTSTATTADRLSTLLVWLIKNGYVKGGKNIRVIGHSLGGHTAGITGKKFFEKYKLEKISRIDAIDPAGPNFDHSPSEFQLTEFNGDFVQVMHCNTGLLGSKMNRGHADFYPNGGDNLPGCEPPNGTRRRRSLTSNAEKHICNHLRCIDLYIEMLQEEQVGCKCASWKKFLDNQCDCATSTDKPRMGYFCPETAKGTYYLNVTMNSKFDYGNTTAPKEREDATSKLIGGMQETSSQLLTSISEMTKGVEPPTNDPAHEPITATTPKPENVTTT